MSHHAIKQSSQVTSQSTCFRTSQKYTPPKTNIDTQNDALQKVTPASKMARIVVSMLDFWWVIFQISQVYTMKTFEGKGSTFTKTPAHRFEFVGDGRKNSFKPAISKRPGINACSEASEWFETVKLFEDLQQNGFLFGKFPNP